MSSVVTNSEPSILRGFARETVVALSARKNEPDWLRDLRLTAWETFEAMAWPTGKEEAWRRLDLSAFSLDDYLPYADPGYRLPDRSGYKNLTPALREHLGTNDGYGALVQHDSEGVYQLLGATVADSGLIFTTLDNAVHQHPDLVRAHLGTAVQATDDKFAALHYAFMSGGAFLYVPAGMELTVPGRAIKWLAQPGGSLFAHTVVVVERGATVTLIDDYLGPDDVTAFDCSAAELFVRDGAKLSYIVLQQFGKGVTSVSHLRGETGRDATIDWLLVSAGGKATRVSLDADLKSAGASNVIKGACFGDAGQQFDVHTFQDHIAPHTTSDLLFKNVLKDNARSAFSGLIRVAPGAQRTDAYLANRNLLLSDKARADSIPTLEIEANDVRCTHGATVGPIDEQQVFYLMARGIPRSEAVQMIVEGFLEPILSGIPVEAIRGQVEGRIAARLTTI